MLQAALLWYSKFREDLESKGFKVNLYDPCVTNRVISDKKHTIIFHVDDLKSSHEDKRVNDQVEKGNLTITYCPTDAIIRDFMSKPLQGSKF